MAGIGKVMGKKFFRDWKDLNDNWGKAVERNMGRKVEMDRASKQVDVERLKRNVRVGGWQPEPSMGDSGRGRAPRAALGGDLEELRVWQTLGGWWKVEDQSRANSEMGKGPKVWQTLGHDGGLYVYV
jgi:hypothetical protein